MNNKEYTREQLLNVIASYQRMIERSGTEYPTVVISDIFYSIKAVLDKNNYDGYYKELLTGKY